MTRLSARRLRGLACAATLAVLAVTTVGTPPATASSSLSSGRAPADFVALRDVEPTILEEMRYTGPHNFVGRRIRGYLEPVCLLTRPAAEALQAAQRRLLDRGYTLKVYDCFRPQRAVDHFVRWARNPFDRRMKAEFYPNVDKSRLFEEGYIAERSGHSRGSTVDLTLVKLPVRPQRPYRPGEPLVPCFAPVGERFPDNSVDMGTGFDCFDTLSHTDDSRITGAAREHRDLLRDTLAAVGFRNLPEEWWHFTFRDEPYPDTYFDFPVTRHALPH
ncbi:D-alanyl-D-alanine dipeptidase [Amycolatopsis arida]|uniref:D-alanyl-D-alanine dipeptidase n=1 Tax=Amycolatopsis arida TaxID=587909 RepID=A0A1I6A3Q8_9PSEU|nr:M15 family metallopeptidase [Amycolatopsis arida]TDX88639.1 D-alanyl-D-alanine dipeptidase [Amycolatopsis arida]SFQ63278.1 D-alanyl-D-alanine dipeptidase [Amycolatopsis arida]